MWKWIIEVKERLVTSNIEHSNSGEVNALNNAIVVFHYV